MKSVSDKNIAAFTLVEMLVVMSILVILTGMAIPAFSGLRSSIILNETSKNMQQVFRNTQRAAMLLSKGKDERWIYGVGIDFTSTTEDGRYKMFKWCSPFEDYGIDYQGLDGDISTGKLPNYNEDTDLAVNGNGMLPVDLAWEDNCNGTPAFVSGVGVLAPLSSSLSGTLESPTKIGYLEKYKRERVSYVVFESITGRALFYDGNGALMNFSNNADLLEDAKDLQIFLSPPSEDRVLEVAVTHISGKVTLKTLKDEDVPEKIFYFTPENDVVTVQNASEPVVEQGDLLAPTPTPTPTPVSEPAPAPAPAPTPVDRRDTRKSEPEPAPKPDPDPVYVAPVRPSAGSRLKNIWGKFRLF